MTESISVYATKIDIDLDDKSVNLQGFDLSQLIAEFSKEEVLEVFELGDIADYLSMREKQAIEEQADETFIRFLGEDYRTSVNKLSVRGN